MNYTKNLKTVFSRDEIHVKSQIILKVYSVDNGFVFSVNCKLGRFVRSYYPTPEGKVFESIPAAKRAAQSIILKWVKESRTARKYLQLFDFMYVDQMELFPELA